MRPCCLANSTINASSDDLPRPMTLTSRVRPQMLRPSRFRLAAIRPGGTGGCSMRNCEPSRPCSSAATAAKSTLRFGAFGCALIDRAIASIAATPDALSTAPL